MLSHVFRQTSWRPRLAAERQVKIRHNFGNPQLHVSIHGHSSQVFQQNVQLHIRIEHVLRLGLVQVIVLPQALQFVSFVQTLHRLIVHKVLHS